MTRKQFFIIKQIMKFIVSTELAVSCSLFIKLRHFAIQLVGVNCGTKLLLAGYLVLSNKRGTPLTTILIVFLRISFYSIFLRIEY